MPNNKRRILSLVLAAVMICGLAGPAWAEESVQSAQAATMQLMRTEGTVSVTNSSGRSLSTRDDMRLYNGYHVATQAASYAWIDLDDQKLTKLDQVSEAELRKSGKALELMLNSGGLFFNVTSPLAADETLNIRTSTMVVGIRGTSGWVRVSDRWSAEIYVLEGKVECSVADPVTGQVKTATIQSGQKATAMVYPQDQAGDKCDILMGEYQAEEIDGFALVELASDPALCQEILEASGMDILSALGEAQEQAAQQRLEQDQQTMQGLLDNIAGQLARQERTVSTGHVWNRDNTASAQPQTPAAPEAPSSESGAGIPAQSTTNKVQNAGDYDTSKPSSGSSGGGGGSSSSGGSSSGSSVVRVKSSETTAAKIHSTLRQSVVQEVIVEPGGEHPQLIVDVNLEVPSGKKLTVDPSVSVNVVERARLTVYGTMTGGYLGNYGTVEVYSSNTLELRDIANSGRFLNAAKGRVKVANMFLILEGGILHNEGALECYVKMEGPLLQSGETGTEGGTSSTGVYLPSFYMEGGTLKPPSGKSAVLMYNSFLQMLGGTIESEVYVDDGGYLLMEGGTIEGGDKSALVLAPGSEFEMRGGEVTSQADYNTISAALSSGEYWSRIRFDKGTVTNRGKGFALYLSAPNSFDYVRFSETVFRVARSDHAIQAYWMSDEYLDVFTPEGYTFTGKQSDGYYHLEPGAGGGSSGGGEEEPGEEPGGEDPGGEPGEEPEPEPDNSTKVNDTSELWSALSSAEPGEVIKLTDGFTGTIDQTVTLTKGDSTNPVVLDLNGQRLTSDTDSTIAVYGGALVIRGNGGDLETEGYFSVENGGYLSLETVTVTSNRSRYDVFNVSDHSTLIIDGGTTVEAAGSGNAISSGSNSVVSIMANATVNGSVTLWSTEFTLDGGVINNTNPDIHYTVKVYNNVAFNMISGEINFIDSEGADDAVLNLLETSVSDGTMALTGGIITSDYAVCVALQSENEVDPFLRQLADGSAPIIRTENGFLVGYDATGDGDNVIWAVNSANSRTVDNLEFYADDDGNYYVLSYRTV